MSDFDLTLADEYMAQPAHVWCEKCNWDGFDYELVNSNCPNCGNDDIKCDLCDDN